MKYLPKGDYVEALARMKIDPANFKMVSEFQAELRRVLGGHLYRGQIQAFSDVFRNLTVNFKDYNIESRTYPREGYVVTRYIIPGKPGLFSYLSVSQYVQEVREQ